MLQRATAEVLRLGFPILATYSASKAAMHSLTQVTRAMLRGQNTQVFGVYPGPIDTRMGEVLTVEKASRRTPRG